MKITCHECKSELEVIDLHDDGSEILVKLCKEMVMILVEMIAIAQKKTTKKAITKAMTRL